jgi:hypothetical protein
MTDNEAVTRRNHSSNGHVVCITLCPIYANYLYALQAGPATVDFRSFTAASFRLPESPS